MIKFEWPRYAVIGMRISMAAITVLLVGSFVGLLIAGKLG